MGRSSFNRRYVVIIGVTIMAISWDFSLGQEFNLGIKAGPLFSIGSFGDKEDKDTFSSGINLGYTGGVLVGFPLGNKYSVFGEAAYSKKGRKIKFNDGEWTNIGNYKFLDLSMVLRRSFRFRLRKDVPSELFVNIGPEVAYWLSGKGTIKADGPGYDYEIVFDGAPDGSFDKMYIDNANRWLFGLIIGTGFEAPIRKNHNLVVEFRFVSGHTFLSNAREFDKNNYPILGFEDTLRMNLKTFSVTLSYVINEDIKELRKGKSTKDKEIRRNRR
jgi:Outer membrane protein beta-barrel domain